MIVYSEFSITLGEGFLVLAYAIAMLSVVNAHHNLAWQLIFP
jgi:hypothetical protein